MVLNRHFSVLRPPSLPLPNNLSHPSLNLKSRAGPLQRDVTMADTASGWAGGQEGLSQARTRSELPPHHSLCPHLFTSPALSSQDQGSQASHLHHQFLQAEDSTCPLPGWMAAFLALDEPEVTQTLAASLLYIDPAAHSLPLSSYCFVCLLPECPGCWVSSTPCISGCPLGTPAHCRESSVSLPHLPQPTWRSFAPRNSPSSLALGYVLVHYGEGVPLIIWCSF